MESFAAVIANTRGRKKSLECSNNFIDWFGALKVRSLSMQICFDWWNKQKNRNWPFQATIMWLRRIKTRKTAFWPTLSLAYGDESHKNAENILIKRRKKVLICQSIFFCFALREINI